MTEFEGESSGLRVDVTLASHFHLGIDTKRYISIHPMSIARVVRDY